MKFPTSQVRKNQVASLSASSASSQRGFITKNRDLKLWIVLLVLILITFALYVLANWADGPVPAQWLWLRSWPLASVASSCMGIVIIAFAYEWFVRNESEAKLVEKLEQALREHERVVSTEMARTMFTSPALLREVFTPSVADEVVRAALEARLGSDQLAREAYDSFLSQIVTSQERRQNYSLFISLTGIRDPLPDTIKATYFDCHVHESYETILRKKDLHFACVGSTERYIEMLRDSSCEECWMAEKNTDFPNLDDSVFTLSEVTVNGLKLNLASEKHAEKYLVRASHDELEKVQGQTVRIDYHYRTRVQKRGHSFLVNMQCPAKNVKVDFDYAETDISYVNVLDFMVSKADPRIHRYPTYRHQRRVEIEVDEWVFPKGGVVFVWVLSEEMSPGFVKLLTSNKPAPRGNTTRTLI